MLQKEYRHEQLSTHRPRLTNNRTHRSQTRKKRRQGFIFEKDVLARVLAGCIRKPRRSRKRENNPSLRKMQTKRADAHAYRIPSTRIPHVAGAPTRKQTHARNGCNPHARSDIPTRTRRL